MSDSDPYHQFASDVSSLLSLTRTSFTSYLRIRSLVTSPTNPELLSSKSELLENLQTLTDDLTDLTAAVRAVEADPYRYGLDVSDVSKRRRFVEDATKEVESMKEELEKPVVPLSAAARREDTVESQGRLVTEDEDDERDEDAVARFEHQQQQELMRAQDESMARLQGTVSNLYDVSYEMNHELEVQKTMLDEVEEDVDRVEGKLKKGMKDLNTFIRKNEDTASNWCIGLLILVLVILLFLLLVL
ncbi:SNARE domain-containing protein [Ascodesmis nigricans]|uniref:SNARE domain-containing protein n=1 Tax=Ascodesmis nigricans TaxID=341454 RepID=A0A4S2N4U7_9PEZI|nr:SNARE domain-containing protein [Ascodesmis nigricans]